MSTVQQVCRCLCCRSTDCFFFFLFSICLIHGLAGNSKETWTFRSPKSRKAVFWPRDLLPKQIPRARILTYGYETDVASSHYLTQRTLYGHAKDLICELVSFREKENALDRPIVFIVHGVGGILIKSALIFSREAEFTTRPTEQSLFLATAGVVFMGTPQRRIQDSELSEIVRKIIPALHESNFEEESAMLERQVDRYKAIGAHMPQVFCYETKKSKGLGEVVPRDLAIPVKMEENCVAIAMPSDHLNMTKFEGLDDPGYKRIEEQLHCLYQKSVDTLAARHQQLSKERGKVRLMPDRTH